MLNIPYESQEEFEESIKNTLKEIITESLQTKKLPKLFTREELANQ